MKFLLTVLLLLIQGCGQERGPTWETIQGNTMGTVFTIKLELPPNLDRGVLEPEVNGLLKSFDGLMSNWNPDSWVTQFNKSRETEWRPVDPMVIEILEVSRQTNVLSGGAFDITISPLIEWWGFGASDGERVGVGSPPPTILAKIGMDKLEWREAPPTIRKLQKDLEINCSAVAKGYGVDLVARHLSARGIEHYMVEIGGEVRVNGKPEGRDAWLLGIRHPDSGGNPVFAKVKMPDGRSLATSGDYLNAFNENGKRYCHILNPKTGLPVEHQLTSVSILGKDCAMVDALATACMVLGEKAAMELIEKMEGFEALFIVRGEGSYVTSSTSGFPILKEP